MGAHDEIKKAAATVTENAKLISAKMEKVERELEEEKKVDFSRYD